MDGFKEFQGKNLAFTWLKKFGLFKCPQYFRRLSEFTLWCSVIELNNFFSCCFSCVSYFCKDRDHTVFFRSTCYFPIEICVGKSKPKRIIYSLRCTRNCFKVTVSYINIFCVIYIECRLMEVCC